MARRCTDQLLQALLEGPDDVQVQAAYALGRYASLDSLEPLLESCENAPQHLRVMSMRACTSIAVRHPSARPAVLDVLREIVRRGPMYERVIATTCCATLHRCGDAQATGILEQSLACGDPQIEVHSAVALAARGPVPMANPAVAQAIERNAGGGLDDLLAPGLLALRGSEFERAAEPYLASSSDVARRHAAIVLGQQPPDDPADEAIERAYRTEVTTAVDDITDWQWTEFDHQALAPRLRTARLVLFGEIHDIGGPLRADQAWALRQFCTAPDHEALGYEPSVEDSQAPVVAVARELGMRTIACETNWVENIANGRHGRRDVMTADTIHAWLRRAPEHRMFVLRGATHVWPTGFLHNRLEVDSLILSDGTGLVVPLCFGLDVAGRTFHVTDGRSEMWILPTKNIADEVGSALRDWLARPHATSTPSKP